MAAAATALLSVVVGLGLVAVRGDAAGVDVAAGGDTVAVAYERVEYKQEAQLTCEGRELRAVDTFDQATFEAWGDRDGRRWRSTVTYPDGTSRDLIALDSPWYPSELYSRGSLRGAVLGCDDTTIGALVAEPGQNAFYSLNPLAEVPVSEAGTPAVPGYAHLGTRVPGAHTDSLGRPADLWRQVVSGFFGDDETDMRGPLTQTTEWFVDAATGDVLEMTYENAVDNVGTARSTTTRVEFRTMNVSPVLFDPAGYSRVAVDEGAPSGSTATTASASPVRGAPGEAAPQPRAGEPLADGNNAVLLASLDVDAMTVTVDVIEWLTGDVARDAYAAETGETDGPPNDYMTRNESDELRTLSLDSPMVTVAWNDEGPAERGIPLDELPEFLEQRRAVGDLQPPFWISVEDGKVVRLDEQYRP